jgi:phospholipase C
VHPRIGEGYDNGTPGPNYCGICDPMHYSSSIMTDPARRANIQHGTEGFDSEATTGTLPAVSFLKPGDDDGHPGYSTLAAVEAFVTHAVDEGGGYSDSGYVQPVSFFGDGTRVPMLVICPYTKPGHRYTDRSLDPDVHRSQPGLAALV